MVLLYLLFNFHICKSQPFSPPSQVQTAPSHTVHMYLSLKAPSEHRLRPLLSTQLTEVNWRLCDSHFFSNYI